MILVQVLILIFAIFALSRVIIRYKDNKVGLGEFIFWCVLWVIVGIITIFPDLISGISSVAGIGRGVDLAIYISIILLFYMVYRIYVKLDEQEQKMTKIIREITISNNALKNSRDKKKR